MAVIIVIAPIVSLLECMTMERLIIETNDNPPQLAICRASSSITGASGSLACVIERILPANDAAKPTAATQPRRGRWGSGEAERRDMQGNYGYRSKYI